MGETDLGWGAGTGDLKHFRYGFVFEDVNCSKYESL